LTVVNAMIECRAHNNQRREMTIEEYLREYAEIIGTMSASQLAEELTTLVAKPITPEIARHAASVCGIALANTKGAKSTQRQAIVALIDAVEALATDVSASVSVTSRLDKVRRLMQS
jgi:MoxR-like ATPase